MFVWFWGAPSSWVFVQPGWHSSAHLIQMSLGLSKALTAHLLSMPVAMVTSVPICKENWKPCSLHQKLHSGIKGACLLQELAVGCLLASPPTHFHQTMSYSTAEVKVYNSFFPAGVKRGNGNAKSPVTVSQHRATEQSVLVTCMDSGGSRLDGGGGNDDNLFFLTI